MHRSVVNILNYEQEWEKKLQRARASAKRALTSAEKKGEKQLEEARKEANKNASAHHLAIQNSTKIVLKEITEQHEKKLKEIQQIDTEELSTHVHI